jgi:hypothetical protein
LATVSDPEAWLGDVEGIGAAADSEGAGIDEAEALGAGVIPEADDEGWGPVGVPGTQASRVADNPRADHVVPLLSLLTFVHP